MRKKLSIAVLSLFLGVLGFSTLASEVPDSLLTEKHILPLVVSNPDSVLVLIDLAQKRQIRSLPSYKQDQLRAYAYNELHMYSLVEMYANRALQSISVEEKPKDVLKLLVSLTSSQFLNGKYQQSIESSMKAMQIARSVGNRAAELNILGTMSKVSFAMGNREQGFDYLNQIIDMSADSEKVGELANVSWAMGLSVIELCTDKQYDEAIMQSRKRLRLIRRIKEAGPTPGGYIDQQYAYTYARLALAYQLIGNVRDAKKSYLAYNDTEFSKTLAGGIAICDYLLEAKQYKDIVKRTDSYYPYFAKDTITSDYAYLLRLDARAKHGMGNSAEAYSLLERADVIQDSLFVKQSVSKVNELATFFNINEKELQLEKNQVELQKRHIQLLITGGVGLLILLALFVMLFYYQLLLKKYKKAAHEIDQLLSQREAQREEVASSDSAIDKESGQMEEKKLLQVENIILTEKLFLSSGNIKKEIAEKTNLTQAELVRLIQVETQLSFPEFLNKLRIDYSIAMMKKYPEWTIEAVAQEAGFNNRGTYYQNFNKFYNMTPMQYRKAHEE